MNLEFSLQGLSAYGLEKLMPESMQVYPSGVFKELYRLLYLFRKGLDSGFLEEYILGWLAGSLQVSIAQRLPWLSSLKVILEQETEEKHTIPSLAERVFLHT